MRLPANFNVQSHFTYNFNCTALYYNDNVYATTPTTSSTPTLECATGLVHRAPPCQLQRPKPFHLQLQLHRFILQRQRLRHHTDNVFHANTGVCYGVSPPCASLPTSTSKAISLTTSTPPPHTTTTTSTPPQRQHNAVPTSTTPRRSVLRG